MTSVPVFDLVLPIDDYPVRMLRQTVSALITGRQTWLHDKLLELTGPLMSLLRICLDLLVYYSCRLGVLILGT